MSFIFPEFPKCGIAFPTHPLLAAAVTYTKEHTSPMTVNHCIRSAAYALLLINKIPSLANVDKELVVLAAIFHDLGWSTTPLLISKDKRFEVDGANAARTWIEAHIEEFGWNKHQVQLVWDAIALHATPSIAQHKEAEVVAVQFGISADFLGWFFPGDAITREEHQEIVKALPRLNMSNEVTSLMCGFCRTKPETTYDNLVSGFGVKFGLDGKGNGKEDFAKAVDENATVNKLMGVLKVVEENEA